MATLSELCKQNALVQMGGGLEDNEQPERLLYAYPHVVKWLDETLPTVEPLMDEGKQSPIAQVDDLFHDFVSGADLSDEWRSHSMKPIEPGIWELKTPDIRIFGWFTGRGIFVIGNVDTAFRCKQHELYAGYRDNTIRRRDALALNEPKFILGEYDDVL